MISYVLVHIFIQEFRVKNYLIKKFICSCYFKLIIYRIFGRFLSEKIFFSLKSKTIVPTNIPTILSEDQRDSLWCSKITYLIFILNLSTSSFKKGETPVEKDPTEKSHFPYRSIHPSVYWFSCSGFLSNYNTNLL